MPWDKRPTLFIGTVEDDIAGRRTEIALYGHRGIVLKSPVRTGRFRGSSVISYGTPRFDTVGSMASQGAAISKGIADIAVGANEPFAVVYITSALPYSEALERGYSPQAPQGVYGVTYNDMRVKYAL